ncbi:MAG: hypothetical protein SGI77_25965 [Pirellulaceae bacterium]|nr:hypothetical protein [Pirellulaceae bacterium]
MACKQTRQRNWFLRMLLFVQLGICSVGHSEESTARIVQEPPELEAIPGTDPTLARFTQSIKELGSPIYRERQSAFLRLWEMADLGHQKAGSRLIEQALLSTDIDVAASARWLQVLMRLSASPSEASKLIEDLALIRSGDTETILRLARNHQWEHLLAMLDVLTPNDRMRLLSEPEALFSLRVTVVSLAWKDHEESKIPAIVDYLWTTAEAINARKLWQMLGMIAWSRQRPSRLDDVNDEEHWEIVSEQVNGRILESVAAAQKLGRERLASSILVDNGLWKASIPANADQPPPAGSISSGGESVVAARTALILQWSGNVELSQKWTDAIGLPGPSEEDVNGVMLALSLCGRTEDAVSIAEKRSPDEAFDYFVRHGRISDAMHSIGIEQLDEPSIQRWLDSATTKPTLDRQSDIQITERMAAVGCMLSRLGQKDLGDIVDQAVIQWASSIGEDHGSSKSNRRITGAEVSRDRWKAAMETWTSQHRRPFALTQFRQLLRERIDHELQEAILRILYDNRDDRNDMYRLASSVLQWLGEQRGSKDYANAAGDLERLFSGRSPESWPEDWQRGGFPALGRSLLQANGSELDDDELPIQLARFALMHQRTDLFNEWLCFGAEPGFREWISALFNAPPNLRGSHDILSNRLPVSRNRLVVLGEMLLKQKDYSRAIVVLERLIQLNPERLDLVLKLSHCHRAIGETELADQIRLQVLSMPLTVPEIRGIVAEIEREPQQAESERLLRNGLLGSQNRPIENWILAIQLALLQHSPTNLPPSETKVDHREQRSKLKAIIDDDRRQLLYRLDCFTDVSFKLRYAIPTLEMLYRDTAKLAILDEDFQKADQAIRACHAVYPDQIESPIELIPMAEKVFGVEKTEEWLELYASPLESHMSQWPDDTLVGNNLAWFYANIDRRLDRALELSQHVAELLPDDSIYLDTLAEAEFRLGHIDEAIAISSKCRQLTPLEDHHRAQLHRFLKRKKD